MQLHDQLSVERQVLVKDLSNEVPGAVLWSRRCNTQGTLPFANRFVGHDRDVSDLWQEDTTAYALIAETVHMLFSFSKTTKTCH